MINNALNLCKLNLGCGDDLRDGFINVDEFNPKADLKVDLATFPYPWETASVDEVVMSHSIEHISWRLTPSILYELQRILKEGGSLQLSYPDFELCAKAFIDNTQGLRWKYWMATLYGLQTNDGQYHKAPIVTAKLMEDLRYLGFEKFQVKEDSIVDRTVTCIKAQPMPWFPTGGGF